MDPVLAGYMCKRTAPAPADRALPAHVLEIGSASGCISEEPEDWIQRWAHNELWLFDTPERALSVVPDADRRAFDVYAYRVLPRLFAGGGGAEDWALPELRVAPLTEDFVRLGWDVVSRSVGTSFECSPLSCNGLAREVPVNAQCLLETPEEALALVASDRMVGVEPGPYVVVEVWRRP